MPEMRNLTIRYFAILREQSGVAQETIASSANTPSELYDELATRYGFKMNVGHVRTSVNGSFQFMDYALQDGDEVVFIPPVAGG